MKDKKITIIKILITMIIIITAIVVVLIIINKMEVKNDLNEIGVGNSTKTENVKYHYKSNNKEQIEDDYEIIDDNELRNMSGKFDVDNQLKNVTDNGNKWLKMSEKVCNTANDAEEIILKEYEIYDDVNIKLNGETQYYYTFNLSYKYSNGYKKDIFSEGIVLIFKNSVIDLEHQNINLKEINSAKDLQNIFDIYYYCKLIGTTDVYKIFDSGIEENNDKYIYTIYYNTISHGDWGMNDTLYLCETHIEIMKENGEFFISGKTLKKYFGDYHPNPIEE